MVRSFAAQGFFASAATPARRIAFVLIAASASGVSVAAEPAAASPAEWNFRALLDGRSIGEHRFRLSVEGDKRKVVSQASFDVKFLGLTAYRYRHQATEEWRGDCLAALHATTDDDGKSSTVRATREGDTLQIHATAASASASGCVMSFAYWNPAIQTQSRLLNAQNGKLEAVEVRRIGHGTVDVRGKPVDATGYRITGPEQPIDVWYSAEGQWLGLDSIVGGNRKLSYRLQ